MATVIANVDDATLLQAVGNLGGHDITALQETYAKIVDSRPPVILAYTVKGHGLPIQGHPQNHSSLSTDQQFTQLAEELGEDSKHPFSRFGPRSTAGQQCRRVAKRPHRNDVPNRQPPRCQRISQWGQPSFPIGVLYDPFVERALEPWSFGIYAGGCTILVGTPSGVTLAAMAGTAAGCERSAATTVAEPDTGRVTVKQVPLPLLSTSMTP